MRQTGGVDDAGLAGRLGRSPTAVLVLLLIAAAGALLPAYLALVGLQRSSVDRVALTLLTQSGERTAHAVVEPQLAAAGLTSAVRRSISRTLAATPHLLEGRLWDARMRLVASTRGTTGRTPRSDEHQVQAMSERRTVAVREGDTIHVHVPVRDPFRRNAGALELHYDYRPVAAEIAADTRTIRWILALVAFAVYAALLPVLRTSARTLARQHNERHPPLERELREAMRRRELHLHFQPKLDVRTGEIDSVEGLLRWQSPTRGAVAPGEFLPQVEETDLIDELTEHVAALAAAQARDWSAEGLSLAIAINISPRTLASPDLAERLESLLDAQRLPTSQFILELTETTVMERPESDRKTLEALVARGFRLAIDDFGTGRSSLERLDRLPVDELKIDRAFVARMEETGDETLVTAMVRLGHDMGMRVVGEGAESRRTVERLGELGCDLVQGYGISRPLPPDELREWCRQRQERARRLTRSTEDRAGKAPEGGRREEG